MKKIRSIYLINGDDSECDYITSVLINQGYKVYQFDSSKSFWRGGIVQSPALIMVDIDLSSATDLELIKKLNQDGETPPIICLCNNDSSQHIVDGFKNGVVGIIYKPIVDQELVKIVGESFIHHEFVVPNLKYQDSYNLLTPREQEVYGYLVIGYKSKEIAELLNISTSTIKIHKSKIMSKMNSSSLQSLASQYLLNKQK